MQSINNNNGSVPSTNTNSTNNNNNNIGHQNDVVEGISRILSRWNGLQMAVENRWGGQDSLQKSQRLADDIFSWFSQSKSSLCMEDVESLLHERMVLTFNTDIEDGSIEEVAEELMILHEEYLQKEVNY